MGNRTIATVQPVAMIQLDPDEVAEMNMGFPVVVNLRTELFVFPPTPKSNVLKMARHGYGYEVEQSSSASSYSAPKLALKQQGQFLPAGAEKALRDGLALFLPSLRVECFIQRRLCWYTDTPKGHFIVDHYPEYENLFTARGASGQYVPPTLKSLTVTN